MANQDAIDNLLRILQGRCCPDVAAQTVLAEKINTLRQSLGRDGERVLAQVLAAAGADSLAGYVASEFAGDLTARLNDALAPSDPCRFRWQRLNLMPLPGLDTFAGTLEAPLQVIVAVLKFIKGILDVLAALLLAIPDPLKALILAAYAILKEIIDNLLATGGYVYFDAPGITSTTATLAEMGAATPELPRWLAGDAPPKLPTPADGFEKWAHTFEQSFDDPGDENRPIFTDGAMVEAVFIVATAPNLVNLRPILTLLANLLDVQAFENAWQKFTEADDEDQARLSRSSVAPDWRSWKLRDIGPPEYPLRQLERLPEMLLGLLQGIDNIVDLIKDLVQAIGDKIDILLELAKILQAVIDMIRALSTSGLHCLRVVTDGGVAGLKKAFLEAENRPNADIGAAAPAGDAVVGVCILGGVGEYGTATLTTLWSLLGADGFDQCIDSFENPFVEKAQRLREQAEKSWEDTKAIADEAWQGAPGGGESATDKGIKGLWGEFTGELEQQKDDLLQTIGLGQAEADELIRSDRNSLVRGMEQALAEGVLLDPRVLAQIEATRRARRRGRRSLAMSFGRRPGGERSVS